MTIKEIEMILGVPKTTSISAKNVALEITKSNQKKVFGMLPMYFFYATMYLIIPFLVALFKDEKVFRFDSEYNVYFC